MIERVKVAGVELPDKFWLRDNITVPNGSYVRISARSGKFETYSISPQSVTLDGAPSEIDGTNIFVVNSDDETPKTFEIKGKYNSDWRYTVKVPDQNNVEVYYWGRWNNGRYYPMTFKDNTYDPSKDKDNFTKSETPLLKFVGKNDHKVEITVNGEPVALNKNGEYTVKTQDEAIVAIARPYERNIPLTIYSDGGDNYIELDPNGTMYKRERNQNPASADIFGKSDAG